MSPAPELVARLWPEGYRVARSILRDHEAAQDAVQETCVKLHVSFDSLRDENAIDRWFFRVLVRECYARLRFGRRQASFEERWVAVTAAPGPGPESVDLQAAVDALPASQRLAVIFRYYYGFADAEVAQILHTSHVAIRVRLFMARRALKAALALDEGQLEVRACP